MVSDDRLRKIDALIGESLNEDAMPAKVGHLMTARHRLISHIPQSGLNALNSRVYAVRANYNRLLDVARETYKENVVDIFELNRALSDKHQLPFQLVYQEGASGFVLALKKSDLEDGGKLPTGFINVTSQKGRLTFSTLELVSLFLPTVMTA
jgi:DNA mismatch repair protein MSH4